jgi:hypothetical protein
MASSPDEPNFDGFTYHAHVSNSGPSKPDPTAVVAKDAAGAAELDKNLATLSSSSRLILGRVGFGGS